MLGSSEGLALLLLLLLAVPAATADVVVLTDGRKLEGVVTDLGDRLRIKMRLGVVTVARSQVVRIERRETPRQALAARRAALAATDVAGRIALADFATRNKLAAEATALYREVLLLDGDHALARRALGYVRKGGQWLTADQARAAAGLVRFRGRWVLPEEQVLVLRKEYLAGATVARVELGADGAGTIHLTHPGEAPRALPARVRRLTGETVELTAVGWPLTTSRALAGLPDATIYALRRRFGPTDGRARLALARWLLGRGLTDDALRELGEAARRDPALAVEVERLRQQVLADADRRALAAARTQWAAGQIEPAIDALRNLALRADAPPGTSELLAKWLAVKVERETLLATLDAVAARLDPRADAALRGALVRFRKALRPDDIGRARRALGDDPAADRGRARAAVRRLLGGLRYEHAPEVMRLAAGRRAEVERWVAGYLAADSPARKALRARIATDLADVSLRQLAGILRYHRRFADHAAGRRQVTYTIAHDDSQTTYDLYVPRAYDPGRAWPLLLYYHGQGGTGDASRWVATAEREGWIVCCPTATEYRTKGWASTDLERSTTLSAVADVRRRLHVDPRRIYLAGASMGGHGAWDVAMHVPDRFAAALAVIGGPRLVQYRLLPNLQHTPLYDAQGARDDAVLVARLRKATAQLTTWGYRCVYNEVAELGHHWIPGTRAAFARFVRDVRKPLVPHSVVLRTINPRYTRAFWLEITAADQKALKRPLSIPGFRGMSPETQRDRAIAAYEKQVAEVRGIRTDARRLTLTATRFVRTVRVYLAPELVDLSGPLTITLDGREAFRGRVRPSAGFMLETAAQQGTDRIWWTSVEVSR